MSVRPWLRVLRVPLAPTAAWDACAAGGFALAAGGRGLGAVAPSVWGLVVLTALATYAFGMGLNDWADRRRDRVLAPERPLPSGDLGAAAVLTVVLALGLAALVLGLVVLRSEVVVPAVLAAAAYDLAPRRGLVPGALAMGLVRASNASLLVWWLVRAGQAPAWTLLGPAAIGLYAAAITVWSTTEEREAPARLAVARVLSIAAFLGAGALAWAAAGRPTLGILLAAGAAASVAFGRTPRAGPARRQVLEMLLGLYVLSWILASAWEGGSVIVGLGALGLALLLIWASQRLVLALRPPPAPRAAPAA